MSTSVRHAAHEAAVKVPEITIFFWIIKILTTAMGEATSDFLVGHYNPYIAAALGFVGLAAVLALQFGVRTYIAWVYWLAAAGVSVTGTMAADVLHVQFGVPYVVSSGCFAVVLAAVFMLWHMNERTLSIHSITTRKREMFYWAAVMATFALGTATGDLTAFTLHLGFLSSGLLFAVVFALPALAYWLFGINAIFAFWFAYVVTRPLGASFADWMGKPRGIGGLGWGDGTVSVGLTMLIIVFVGYISLVNRQRHIQE